MGEKKRCPWCLANPVMTAYHDEEWGVPVHDDNRHFEFMLLDAFQAGLNWSIILNKRANFRSAFSGFDPEKISRYNRRSVERLLGNAGIVRNRMKIEASIENARVFLRVQDQHGSFDHFIWSLVNGRTRHNRWRRESQIPARTSLSDRVSQALGQQGFRFVGSTICYAYMQAAGMVNDHLVSCFRHTELTPSPR